MRQFPKTVVESELFVSMKGPLPGAQRRKAGLFLNWRTAGTIFLDEIGDAPSYIQVNLLRVLEERAIMRVGGERRIPVDIRVIAARTGSLRGWSKREPSAGICFSA